MARPATERYGIVLYGPRNTQDPMDVYNVYNAAMVTIDGILFDLQAQISRNKKAIEDLDAKVENYNRLLNKRIDDLDAKVENYNTQLNNRIDNLDAKVERYKQEIDNSIAQINRNITQLGDKTDAIWVSIQKILDKMQGGGTIDKPTGNITFGETNGKVAIGTINLNSGSGIIKTHDGTLDNDVRVV
jgi:uncharacterized protein YoxC